MKRISKILLEQLKTEDYIISAPKNEMDALLKLQRNLPGLMGESTIDNLAYGNFGPILQNIEGRLYTSAVVFQGKKTKGTFYLLYDGKIVKREGEKYVPVLNQDGTEMYYENYQNFAGENLMGNYEAVLKKFGLETTKFLYEKLGKLRETLSTKLTQKGAIGDILIEFNDLLSYFYPNDLSMRLLDKKNKPVREADLLDLNYLEQNYDRCNLKRYGIPVDKEFFIPPGIACGLAEENYEIDLNECKSHLKNYFKMFLYRNIKNYSQNNVEKHKGIIERCQESGAYEDLILKREDMGKLQLASNLDPFKKDGKLNYCEIVDIINSIPFDDNIFHLGENMSCSKKTKRTMRKSEKTIQDGLQRESLNKIIRKTIIETKENKTRLLQENKIVRTRFNFILENADYTTKKGQNEIFRNILSEMIYMELQGFDKKVISENVLGLFGVLSNLFGRSTSGIIDSFKEKGIQWIVEQLGWGGNSYMKNFLITSLGNVNVMDVPKLFTDCDYLTKKIAESIPEAYLRKLEYEKGLGGMFTDVVRNTLYDVVRESSFAQKLEASISGIVCPIVTKLTGIFSNKLGGLKTQLVGA